MGASCASLTSMRYELAAAGDTVALADLLSASISGNINRPANPQGAFQGGTVLHVAAANDRDHTVAWLLDSGADLAATDANGDTPLHLAVAHRSVRTLVVLTQYLCSPRHAREATIAIASTRNRKGELFFHGCPNVWLEPSDGIPVVSKALRGGLPTPIPPEPSTWVSPYDALTASPFAATPQEGPIAGRSASNSLCVRSPGSSHSLSFTESVSGDASANGETPGHPNPGHQDAEADEAPEVAQQRRSQAKRDWRLIRRFCHALWLQAMMPNLSPSAESTTIRRVLEQGTYLVELRWLLTAFGGDRFYKQAVPNTGLPPLLLAIRRNQLAVAALLLEVGGGAMLGVAVDGSGNTALHHAVTTMLTERDDSIFEFLNSRYPDDVQRIAFRTNDAGFRPGEIADRVPQPHSPGGSSLHSSVSFLANSANESTLFDVMLPSATAPFGVYPARTASMGSLSPRRHPPENEAGRWIQPQSMNRSGNGLTPAATGQQEQREGKTMDASGGESLGQPSEQHRSGSANPSDTPSAQPVPLLQQTSFGSWDPGSSNGPVANDSLHSFQASILVAPELTERHRMVLQLSPSIKPLSPVDSQRGQRDLPGAEPASPRLGALSPPTCATRPPSASAGDSRHPDTAEALTWNSNTDKDASHPNDGTRTVAAA